MRAFVALELPGAVVESLVQFQDELARTGSDLKLVERENLHFTVKFLGEVSDSQAAQAAAGLRALKLKAIDVAVSGAGAFPDVRRPRVVWAGVSEEDRPAVEPLARAVRGSLEGVGERDDRPFQAHVTLARVRSSRKSHELESLLSENSLRNFGRARLAELKLKSSQLTPGGAVYSDIEVFPLG